MSQKTALKNRPDPRKPQDTPKPSVLPVVEEAPVEELTGSEKFIESMAPHATTIGLVVVAAVLAVIAWGVYQQSRFSGESVKWEEFSQSQFIDQRTGDTQNLDNVAESYAGSNVAVMSSLMSGDIQLKTGLRQLGTDREKGLLAIKKAKTSFQAVVDADDSLKTSMISQRAQYCLAYAQESLGKMDDAKKLYEQFIEAAPEAPLAESARRAVKRCSEDKYATLYQTFTNFEEEIIGDAPGPSIPEKESPGSFPEIESAAGVVPPKGDDTDTRMNADVVAEETAAAQKVAAEKAAANKAAAEKVAADMAAADKAAAEKIEADKAAVDKAAADKAAADKAAADKAAADKAAADKAAADKAAADKAAADKAAADKAAADKAAAEKAAGEAAEKAAAETKSDAGTLIDKGKNAAKEAAETVKKIAEEATGE